MIYDNLLQMIGNTPILKLNSITDDTMSTIYVKLEKYNPGGSVKDRAALNMIESAEKNGMLKPGGVIIEPTSGNTGIALAIIGKLKGYKVIIIMPDTMTIERRNLMKLYGADLILTDGKKGMSGAIEKANELVSKNPSYFFPNQFSNLDNINAHYENTAVEILADLPNLDGFVSGIGTSGTIIGVGKKLKETIPNIIINGVEPESSPVISKGVSGPHKIQGIGAGFVPDIYLENIVDKITTVKDEDAFNTSLTVSTKEGLFLGPSSGAAIFAAISLSKILGPNKNILVMAPDGGEKYLSMDYINNVGSSND
ncbi:MAG: cysteine synthase A [Clostridium sp.]|uniref:cysteine synthase A n=1 Tax=Clostridium sp. TaxID=1506 RepID=UPI003070EB17